MRDVTVEVRTGTIFGKKEVTVVDFSADVSTAAEGRRVKCRLYLGKGNRNLSQVAAESLTYACRAPIRGMLQPSLESQRPISISKHRGLNTRIADLVEKHAPGLKFLMFQNMGYTT